MPILESVTNRPQSASVYLGADWRVVSGANEGDPLTFAQELELDDVFALSAHASRLKLALLRGPDGQHRIAAHTETGTKGADIHLDCALSLMGFDGVVSEALVLVEVDRTGNAVQSFLLPLAPLEPKKEYRLVGIDTQNVSETFARAACVSFTRETKITLGTGQQKQVEELRPGDAVLTRDDGVQPIRWIGQNTQRAVGSFAPIRIAAGTLNNARDLLVSQDHRLFIYQRSDHLGAGRSELLIKAKHLVNGSTVTIQRGGFVDYFQLLFDDHQIIYAEGIAAESMLVDDRTAPLISADILEKIGSDARYHRELSGLDVQRALLQRPDAVDILKRASKG